MAKPLMDSPNVWLALLTKSKIVSDSHPDGALQVHMMHKLLSFQHDICMRRLLLCPPSVCKKLKSRDRALSGYIVISCVTSEHSFETQRFEISLPHAAV